MFLSKIQKIMTNHIKSRPDAETVIPKLQEALEENLKDLINVQWIRNGSWPTLGEAVDQDRRIFVFARQTGDLVHVDDESRLFVDEIKVKDGSEVQRPEASKSVTVLSTFESM